jgi:protocatechuate 3,4-dioxygenase beta subunit
MPTPQSPDRPLQRLRRREALAGLGALAGAAVWQAARGPLSLARAATSPSAPTAAASCVLSPEVTEGPYWISNHLTRRNLADGRPGLPLILRMTIVDATTCEPIKNADVEVWHADATGVYSGYSGSSPPSGGGGGGGGHATPDNAKRFLRGHQRTDADGQVRFDTIYPGWYRGRTPHIHLKVHVGGNVVHTGQVFFRDTISDAVYRTSNYSAHGQPDTTNAADSIYAQAGGSRALVALTRRSGAKGYRGAITLGVAR